MYPIQSRALSGVLYDARTRELLIRFRKGGAMYLVFGIPPSLYAALLAAQPHPWSRYGAQVMRHRKIRVYAVA